MSMLVKPSWACSWDSHEHLCPWKVHEHAHEAFTRMCAWSCHGQDHFIELCILAPSCKLKLARFSAKLRIQDGAKCGNILKVYAERTRRKLRGNVIKNKQYIYRHYSNWGWPPSLLPYFWQIYFWQRVDPVDLPPSPRIFDRNHEILGFET